MLATGLLLIAAAGHSTAEPGSVVWHDLVTEDAAAAREFYGALFGWTFEKSGGEALLVRHQGQPVAGISQIDDDEDRVKRSTWLVGIEVVRIEEALDTASMHGATIQTETTRTPGFGSFAVLTDPQGAVVLLVRPERTLTRTSGPGAWVWAELWTHHTTAAAAFYAKLFGFDVDRQERPEGPYLMFTLDQAPRAGLVEIPTSLENARPAWAPFVAVAELGPTLKNVRELGGRVLIEPHEEAEGAVALIADPGGAELFVYGMR